MMGATNSRRRKYIYMLALQMGNILRMGRERRSSAQFNNSSIRGFWNIIKNMLQEFEKEKPTSDGYFKPCMRCSDDASNFVTEKLSYFKNIHFLQMPLFKFVVREIKNDGKIVKYTEEIKNEKIIIFTTKIFYIFA